MMEVPGIVEQNDETHFLMMEGHRRTNDRPVRKRIAKSQSLRAPRLRSAPSSQGG